MRRLIEWIKSNKLTSFLALVVIYFLYQNFFGVSFLGQISSPTKRSYSGAGGVSNLALEMSEPEMMTGRPGIVPPITRNVAPTTDVSERLVVRETNISILVEEVRQTVDSILRVAEEKGGYMVSSTLTQPEEAPFATVVVRVPSDKLNETLDTFRGMAIKVASEHITGRDVTDEYEDIDARLETLEKTKSKFEGIMDIAEEIDDILRVQREIINLQSQIDRLKGRQQYLEQTAKLSRITIYLSTDEIALPYTPSDTFRPSVILKLAFRSLVRNVRKIAEAAIWILVYSVIWVPVLGVILFIKRLKKKSTSPQQ